MSEALDKLAEAVERRQSSLKYVEENPGDANNDAELEYCEDMILAAACQYVQERAESDDEPSSGLLVAGALQTVFPEVLL